MNLRAQKGFSLIEITIVLFLAGLLVSGVLMTRKMVTNAKVKNLIKIIEDVRTASNLFYREQGRLPGDGKGVGAARDGWIKNVEVPQFAKELLDNRYMSGKEDLVNSPPRTWLNPLGGYIWVEYKESTAAPVYKDNWIMISGLASNGEIQKYLDDNFDGDGDLTKGRVMVVSGSLLIAL